VLVISLGLGLRLRGYEWGLPFFPVKYGGSLLWGSLVYWLTAVLAPRRSAGLVAGLSLILAIGVELFRLYQTPWLDAFRLTIAGALLLGRVFSLWNILAYAIGILAAAALDHWVRRGR
jgi:hypothetical protein